MGDHSERIAQHFLCFVTVIKQAKYATYSGLDCRLPVSHSCK